MFFKLVKITVHTLWKKIRRFFLSNYGEYVAAFIAAINGIAYAINSTINENKHPILFWIYSKKTYLAVSVCIFVLLQSVIKISSRDTLDRIKKEMERLRALVSLYKTNIDGLASTKIMDLFKKWEFSNSERITVYIHTEASFIPFARYSSNPVLIQKGRTFYPEKEGCIGKAWEEGCCYEGKMAKNKTSFYKMDVSTFEGRHMKAKTIYAHRIGDGAKGLGVIVVESTKPNFRKDSIQNLVKEELDSLYNFIALTYNDIPTPQTAEKEGL